jgi:hypothetical protein
VHLRLLRTAQFCWMSGVRAGAQLFGSSRPPDCVCSRNLYSEHDVKRLLTLSRQLRMSNACVGTSRVRPRVHTGSSEVRRDGGRRCRMPSMSIWRRLSFLDQGLNAVCCRRISLERTVEFHLVSTLPCRQRMPRRLRAADTLSSRVCRRGRSKLAVPVRLRMPGNGRRDIHPSAVRRGLI